MLANYLTTALRHLWRERGYAAINLFGLAVGLALCLLVIQLAAYQLSVGDFHDKKDRVFRVLGPASWGQARYTDVLPIPLGPTLEEQLPEVEAVVRFGWERLNLLRVGDKEGIYEKVGAAEAGVFDMFSLPLLRGDPKTALSSPYTIVLSEPLAHRLFGEIDPLGQVVRVGEDSDYEVTGIARQLPSSSLLQFSALRSLARATDPMLEQGWDASAFRTFVEVTPGADATAVAARIPDIVNKAKGLTERDTRAGGASMGSAEASSASAKSITVFKNPGAPASTKGSTAFSVASETATESAGGASVGSAEASSANAKSITVFKSPVAPSSPKGTASFSVVSETATDAPSTPADSYVLQPLESIYFDTDSPNTIGPSGNPMYLALSAILAVVILTIAGVNYVNLATARAGRRIHEIGVRKALGAHRGQLLRQLLSESVLLSTAATALGAALAGALLQVIPVIAGSAFDLSSLDWSISTYAGAAALAAGVGVLAGAWPAWVVARMQPTANLGGGRMGGARLRRGLVVTQFTATTALLTMTLLMWHQLDYFQDRLRENSILRLRPEQVVVIRNHGLSVDQARALKTELLRDSRIAAVSLSHKVPGEGFDFQIVADFTTDDPVMMNVYQADSDFVPVMGLRMTQGRPLTDAPVDAQAVVINETAASRMGWAQPLGKKINASRGESRIVGVIEDFHFHGPRQKVEPLAIMQVDQSVGVITVRVKPGHLDEALAVIDDKWATVAPYRPIQRHSLEEITANLYSEERMAGRALTAFLLLAIAVAAVGLFGMAAHAAHERTREIGVRKVFGASAGGLTAMMLRDFARPVAIAFVLSVPVAWWLGNQWLHDFAYRVEMGVGLFVVSGALSFLIAGLTVGHQAMRASLTNPVETLRTE